MSGPFGSQQWMYSSGFYPHEIENSARLDANSYYTRTPSSAGNRKLWTWSGWVKRSSSGTRQCIFGSVAPPYGGNNTDTLQFGFLATDEFQLGLQSVYLLVSTQKFRDFSAWYHIVVRVDTSYSDAYANDRVRIYINGEQITDFSTNNIGSTYAPLNGDLGINNNQNHDIGQFLSGNYFNGYIAEVNHVDGSSLAPTAFGETKGDTWVPKKYTGSYGTNGFYLDFATRATDPIDASGNGNNWSSTNVVSTDWMLDSPTNNWATLNPIGPRVNGANYGMGTQTQGNLTVSSTSGSYYSKTSSTIYNHANTGKWYYEIRMDSLDFGSSSGYVQFNIGGNYIWRYYGNSNTLISTGGSFTSLANGDILMFAVDQDNGKGYFGVNGSWYNASGAPDPAAGTNPHVTFSPLSSAGIIGQVELRSGSAVNTVTANFGQDSSFAGQATAQGNTDANGRGDFYYSPPAGFLALCSANMPDPAAAINPAVNNSPQDHFNTVLWTGDGTDDRAITGVGFQPDLTWVKGRSAAEWHNLYDAVRGANKGIYPNDTYSEETLTDTFESFDSDGFTVGYNSSYSSVFTNKSSTTYVAWNWKAGGSGVSNSDGTISSTVSANTDAGVSVVTYNGSSAGTVGHGLGSTPKIVIQKVRNQSGDYWWFGTTAIDGSLDYLQLNDTTAKANSGYTAPTSSVFSNVTFTGATSNVAYCFAEVEGFSKFGSYTGNGSADGPFINTGFRPAFVIIKRTDSANWWNMFDSARQPYNEGNNFNYLQAESNNSENNNGAAPYDALDFVSNGFKLRYNGQAQNASGGTYLYMAFAEMPFKYANAR